MKKILITLLLLTASTFLYSQSMNFNNNKIRIVDSTMGLGISPTSRLHVFGNGTASNLFNVTNDKDATKDSSVVIDAVGNVGIGKTPTSRLEVTDGYNGHGGSVPLAYFRTSIDDKIAVVGSAETNISPVYPAYNIGLYGTARGGTNNFAGYFNLGNVYVRENLGIGRLAPTYRLDVFGNGGATDLMKVSNDINSTYDSTFVIKSNGYVGIGNNNPNHPLQVWGSGDCDNISSEYSGSYLRAAVSGRASGSAGYGIVGSAGTISAKAGLFNNYAGGTALEVMASSSSIAINVISGDVVFDSTRFHSPSITLPDDEDYVFPTNRSWKGEIDVDSLGYTLFTAQIRCDANGTPYLEGVSWKRWSSKTYVEVGSTDGYLNITDGGSGMVITNTLGYTIKATLRFRTKQ